MRPLRSWLIFVCVVFLGGALLAPWLYWLAQSFSSTLPRLAGQPFHRFVDRALLGLALLGLWPLLRGLGARSWRDVGIVKPSGQWGKLAGGFGLGFGSLACVAAAVLLAGGRQFNGGLSPVELAKKTLGAAITAAVVAVLEETLFRGALFGSLRKAWNWKQALVFSSMIYAIAHFFARAEAAPPITWISGLELLPRMLRGFGNLQTLIPGFFNLTLAGVLLGLAYQRTGNLYFSIGLHAGWIFCLKSYGFLTTETPGADPWFWGTPKMIDGWLALLALAAGLVVLARLPLQKPREASA
jgi:membrane protease YdiL (CAAX protease family)